MAKINTKVLKEAEERFWSKVNRNGPIPAKRSELGPCWLWGAAKDPKGYGSVSIGGKTCKAHQVSFKLAGKEVPDGMELDHLCEVRAYVNPGHLEAVTPEENDLRRRGTHCRRGHEFTEENTRMRKDRKFERVCRACDRARYIKVADRIEK